jgi:Fe-S-cluster-containing dehydrogenase component
MPGRATLNERSAVTQPGTAEDSSRRRFLRRAGASLALLAPGALMATDATQADASAAQAASTAERAELQGRFLTAAPATVQTAHPLAAAAARLPGTVLADLADRTGWRADKLSGTLPDSAAPGEHQASAAVSPPDENILLRMQHDLQRALQKPAEQRRWVMVIDLRKCIGCSACTVACKAENKLPPGVVYRPVIEQEIGTYPYVVRRFVPRPCMQCDEPPCVPVCPVGATYKRPDGIVEIDYNACIGCRYCIAACPYGARTFDWGETYTGGTPQEQAYEREPSFEYGRRWSRQKGVSPIGNVRKCQFCLHRLAEGMLPACTTTCVGAATYFGDANDPASLVSEMINRTNVMRLKEELGTKPKVYYLL